jgi:hypothetical protein
MIAVDQTPLLHNMSAPPSTVVAYSGLRSLAKTVGPGGSGVCGLVFKGTGVFGTPVRFVRPPQLFGLSPADILRELGISPPAVPEGDATAQLAALVNRRANELPLPDGCAVIPSLEQHQVIWHDTLSVLAILSKCSSSIWLRAKSPALHAAVQHHHISLLVPPVFAARLPKAVP